VGNVLVVGDLVICFDFTIKYGKNHDWFFMVFHGARSVFHDIFRDLELNTIKNWLVFRGSHNGAPVRVCGCWGEERA
jgi:hypothetical protein